MTERRRPALGIRLFRFAALLLLLTVAASLWATVRIGEDSARSVARERLVAASAIEAASKQRQVRELALYAEILASRPGFKSAVAEAIAENDREALIALLDERRRELGYELALVVDAAGVLAARTDRPEASGVDLSARPLLRQVREKFEAAGVWSEGGRLYETIAVPMAADDRLFGFLVLGYEISDGHALEVQRTSGTETIYASGSDAAASSLPAAEAARALAALRGRGELLARFAGRGAEPVLEELRLRDERWLAQLRPLPDASQAPAGVVISLVSLDRERGGTVRIRNRILASGLAALLVAWALSWLFARRLARSLARPAVVQDLGESAEVATARGGGAETMEPSAQRVPDPRAAGDETVAAPATVRDVALLGVELRSRRRLRPEEPADEVLARLSADLGAVAATIAARGGRVELATGARAVASFDGEARAETAVAAAADLLAAGGRDEDWEPALALASGPVVCGGVRFGGGAGRAVVGLPFDQIEALLREAGEGDLMLSPTVHGELAAALARAGVELVPQRGMLSGQPLYLLTAVLAALVAEAGGESAGRVAASAVDGDLPAEEGEPGADRR